MVHGRFHGLFVGIIGKLFFITRIVLRCIIKKDNAEYIVNTYMYIILRIIRCCWGYVDDYVTLIFPLPSHTFHVWCPWLQTCWPSKTLVLFVFMNMMLSHYYEEKWRALELKQVILLLVQRDKRLYNSQFHWSLSLCIASQRVTLHYAFLLPSCIWDS